MAFIGKEKYGFLLLLKKCLRSDKNVTHNNKTNTKEEYNITHPTLSAKEDAKASCVGDVSSFISHGKFVLLKSEQFDELVKEHGSVLVKDMINQINDYLASSGKKPYKDYAATIRQWIRRKQDQQKTYYGNKQTSNISKHQGLSRDKTERDPSRTFDFSKDKI